MFRPRGGGGGVSIFVRNTLNSESLNNFGSVGDSVECCAVRVYGSRGHSDSHLNIFGLYRRPRGSTIEFIKFLENNAEGEKNNFSPF